MRDVRGEVTYDSGWRSVFCPVREFDEAEERGRRILTSVAALTAVGDFLCPPHARFHDALTISLGSLPGASGLYFLRRRGKDTERNLALGALLPSLFWIGQGLSFLFSGARGFESEFPVKAPRIKDVWLNERFCSAPMLTLLAIGYVVERGRGAQVQATHLLRCFGALR